MLFTVMDYYNGSEILTYNATEKKAVKTAQNRYEMTNGKCDVCVFVQSYEFGDANDCFNDDAFNLEIKTGW